ncbi:RimK family alpha-L-glutamate ligase [Nonomuraea sp. NPDC049028]|uniref:ATP-grasp domain-containing protein n=1 Tax=Nonomuraea sp. NPDC049028 TaxID=3364348 RepID=UPI00371FC093
MSAGLIVGDRGDPHVTAVLTHLAPGCQSWVVNAATLAENSYILQDACLSVRGPQGQFMLSPQTGTRGWIRRLAPAAWQRGMVVESLEAAEKTAWLSLLTAVLRTCGVEWLTGIDALVTAENKLVQHATAVRLGVPTPATMVTNDLSAVREAIGPDIVLKPLGPGHFFDQNQPYTIFTTSMHTDDARLAALAETPFIAQTRICARLHLRVVTVGEEIWGAALDAANQPLDWRATPIAHRSFTAAVLPTEVAHGALAVANALGLGYSSQDWALADEGAYLLDVNPAGQWLFLPQPIAVPVTAALAAWLSGGPR